MGEANFPEARVGRDHALGESSRTTALQLEFAAPRWRSFPFTAWGTSEFALANAGPFAHSISPEIRCARSFSLAYFCSRG